jgi:hypothetical protein
MKNCIFYVVLAFTLYSCKDDCEKNHTAEIGFKNTTNKTAIVNTYTSEVYQLIVSSGDTEQLYNFKLDILYGVNLSEWTFSYRLEGDTVRRKVTVMPIECEYVEVNLTE